MPQPLVVLQSFVDPLPTSNPYNVMLRDALAATPELHVQGFTWPRALLGHYDVFHVHWPEVRLGGSTPLRKVAHQALWVLLLGRLVVTKRPLVRTLHNLDLPSGLSAHEVWMLRAAERITSLWITINTTTTPPAGAPSALILHGHYRDWYARHPKADPVDGRLAFFGGVRRYKGVDDLLRAFRETDDPSLSLVVFGKPTSPELADEVRALAGEDPRIELKLRFAEDAELVEHITSAELVVLPYKEMHNSGGALAALSLDRPILVPRNEVNEKLAAEVGPAWVQMYDGQLSGQHLEQALAAVRSAGLAAKNPDLSAREWHQTGRLHRDAYKHAHAALHRRSLRDEGRTA